MVIMNIKNRFAVTVGICALASFAQNASAQNAHNHEPHTLMIPAVYSIENDWTQQDYDFTAPVAVNVDPSGDGVATSNNPDVQDVESSNSFKAKGNDFVDKLMKKIPYSKQLKYTWDVVDGDVDLYFENLRVDRGNQGVSYKTNTLPIVGDMEGSEIKAEFGQDSKLTFKSDYMPMMGRIDGFQFKASASTDDTAISMRYKTNIDW